MGAGFFVGLVAMNLASTSAAMTGTGDRAATVHRGFLPVLSYAVTIFASAFLLFQVQPLIARMIVPWFGGAAGVWSVCLVFFQTALLLGYLYAHLLTRVASRRTQGRLHALLLALSLLALPIIPRASWKPSGAGDPAMHVLLILALTVGVPYFVLSSTSPLLQAWYAGEREQAAPYRFYALSNLGSMLALLSYPVLVEPWLAVHRQAISWSAAYATVAVLCAAVALAGRGESPAVVAGHAPQPPSLAARALWMALAACGSALLLAVTGHISQNVAAVPFLWVLPLSLYLLSFIVCFEGHGWYRRALFLRLLGLALAAMALALGRQFVSAPLTVLAPLYCAGLFIACMFCHGELARLRPHASHLTSFYLMVSLGGALGAISVALVAPRVFSGLYELPIAIGLCGVLALIVLWSDAGSLFHRAGWNPMWLGLVALVLALNASLLVEVREQAVGVKLMVRNFYGMLRVAELIQPQILVIYATDPKMNAAPSPRYRELLNGTINHGLQWLAPAVRHEPTTYYSRGSGVGVALEAAAKQGPLRVGVIGLGAGTLAAYGRAGDHYTFYEINPLVIEIANHEFTFLRESEAQIDVVPGDARLSLEAEPPQQFDVLAVDAFSGDSIPVHLLTREAFQLYFRHLKPEGVLAVHISNQYLDLQPVVKAGAAALGKTAMVVSNGPDEKRGVFSATWVLVSSEENLLRRPEVQKAGLILVNREHQQLWTDDYSSVFRLLK